jgi:hypothetical protein
VAGGVGVGLLWLYRLAERAAIVTMQHGQPVHIGDVRALGRATAAQVARVIAQAWAQRGVRDIAGWVVSALRALPADEPAAPPRVPTWPS